MNRTDPNFMELKIKGVKMASFYTGFSFKQYIGRPDVVITVPLDENETIPKSFEGLLRRFAHDGLSTILSSHNPEDLEKYYGLLKAGTLEPYWNEIREGEGMKVAVIQGESGANTIQIESLDFSDQFEKIEKQELEAKVKELTDVLEKRNEEVQLLKNQLEQQNKLLDEWQIKLEDLNHQNIQLTEQLKKSTQKPKKEKVERLTPKSHEDTRQAWVALKNQSQLEVELLKINMNSIREIAKPWNVKPNGRTKNDLIGAVVDYINKIT